MMRINELNTQLKGLCQNANELLDTTGMSSYGIIENDEFDRSNFDETLFYDEFYNIMKKLDKKSFEYERANDYATRLQDSSLPFSIEEVFNFITKYTGIKFGIGAEAIQKLLKALDLQTEFNNVQKALKKTDPSKVEFRKLTRRVETIK